MALPPVVQGRRPAIVPRRQPLLPGLVVFGTIEALNYIRRGFGNGRVQVVVERARPEVCEGCGAARAGGAASGIWERRRA